MRSNRGGFTLIEMMIVVGIILLVAGFVAWNYSGNLRQRRVLAAADLVVSYLETAKSNAMKQQLFPYLFKQENITLTEGLPNIPRYWPFQLVVYKDVKDLGTSFRITVQASDISGSTALPTPTDADPYDHTYDLYPIVSLPFGVTLIDPNTGTELTFDVSTRPLFWRREIGSFATGSVVGANSGIAVADAIDPTIRVVVRIDPVYGTITLIDETK